MYVFIYMFSDILFVLQFLISINFIMRSNFI